MTVTVVGIGNTLLADEGAGIEAVRRLEARLADRRVRCAVTERGGLDLLDQLEGSAAAIVVDTARTGRLPAGSITRHILRSAEGNPPVPSRHALSVDSALLLGVAAGLRLPAEVTLFAVEAADIETVGGECTPQVRKALPRLVTDLEDRLREILPDLQATTTNPNTL